jgi:hypothetical protein
MEDDPETVALLNGYRELLEAMRRLTTLTEVVLDRAFSGGALTHAEAAHARHEIGVARDGLERIEVMITLRRQQVRLM